GYR
ncbi:60 kDa chaperonin domain protein, partial [Chlamydia psittaci 84-8471/1]